LLRVERPNCLVTVSHTPPPHSIAGAPRPRGPAAIHEER
jgi:hypothetical protein